MLDGHSFVLNFYQKYPDGTFVVTYGPSVLVMGPRPYLMC